MNASEIKNIPTFNFLQWTKNKNYNKNGNK